MAKRTLTERLIRSEQKEKKIDLNTASQWQLMLFKFRKHKVAVVSGYVLLLLYILGIFCEFFSPYDPRKIDEKITFSPPQRLRFIDPEEGFRLRPFVYGFEKTRDPETLRYIYQIDRTKIYPIYFFVRGDEYRLMNLFKGNLHLFGVKEGTTFLFGTNRLGRDMFSRIIFGARVSTSIGLVGVFISFFIGILLGGFAGYFGGVFDTVLQRIIEVLRSIPSLPLWMSLSAALPPHLPTTVVYFGITVILAVIGWTGIARVVRSKFFSLREEKFVMAAKIAGARERRIIFRHMLPSFASHLIASMTLSIPGMILGETSLSFLGLGIREPAISWGILLQAAQNVRSVSLYPWLLLPGLAVVVTVLAFNFFGDGLRDAADPYAL